MPRIRVDTCRDNAIDRLSAIGRKLPGCARFILESGRIARGGDDVGALLRARGLSRQVSERERSLSGHADACIAAALALRGSPHAGARALAPELADEALREIEPRFPAGYVGEIRALL
jgi:hypothetical protein